MLIIFSVHVSEGLLEIIAIFNYLDVTLHLIDHSSVPSADASFPKMREKVLKSHLSVFQAVQAINGHTNMTPEEFTNMVFQKIDVNNDGKSLCSFT